MSVHGWEEEHVPVREIRVGDLLDLEGDAYADPRSEDPAFPYEYAVVTGREVETVDCIRLDFNNADSVGFRPSHTVKRCGHDDDYDEEESIERP